MPTAAAGGGTARTLCSARSFSSSQPSKIHATLRSVFPLPFLVTPGTTSFTLPDASVVLVAALRKREHSEKVEMLAASVCTAAPTTSRASRLLLFL